MKQHIFSDKIAHFEEKEKRQISVFRKKIQNAAGLRRLDAYFPYKSSTACMT